MNKSQLINEIAMKADISKAQAERALSALTETVTNSLKQREDVALVGFGTFTTSERAARVGRNPKSGEEIQIAAATLPKFKAGKVLKTAVNV